MVEKNCVLCEKLFKTWPCHIRKGNGKFCSSKCAGKYNYNNKAKQILDVGREISHSIVGKTHTEETKQKISESRKGKKLGKNNPRWKGGYIDKYGYTRICVNGRQIRRYRFMIEQKLGRKLRVDEDIHHIDGNKTRDVYNNLMVLSKSEHTKLHFKQDPKKFRERYAK